MSEDDHPKPIAILRRRSSLARELLETATAPQVIAAIESYLHELEAEIKALESIRVSVCLTKGQIRSGGWPG